MFKLASNIVIKNKDGNKNASFDYVAEVDIETKIETLTDTATVKFPKKLAWKGIQIGEYIQRGDEISIDLGYNDQTETVFTGFVAKVKSGIPLELQCEDQMWQLKQIKLPTKHYPTLTLKKLLDTYLPSSIKYKAADVNLGEFRISNEPSLAKVLDYIKDNYVLNFFFRDGIFYGVLPTTLEGSDNGFKTYTFKIQQNVIPGDSLEYTLADDIKIMIKAKTVLKDNTKIEVQEPSGDADGEIRTFYCDTATTEADLKKFAQEKLRSFKVNQMSGSFTAFGLPFIKKGDFAKLLDDKNPERNKKTFMAKSVHYTFGHGGFRQQIELGAQIGG